MRKRPDGASFGVGRPTPAWLMHSTVSVTAASYCAHVIVSPPAWWSRAYCSHCAGVLGKPSIGTIGGPDGAVPTVEPAGPAAWRAVVGVLPDGTGAAGTVGSTG